MEQKAPVQPLMVSKLPKYVSRPVNSPCSQPNGMVHTRHMYEGKSVSGKAVGVAQASAFYMKWTKENGSSTVPPNRDIRGEKRETPLRSSHPPGIRVNKKPFTSTTAGCTPASSVSTGSPKPASKSSRSICISKKRQITSPCNPSSKLTHCGTVDPSPSRRSPGLHKPQDNPSSRDVLFTDPKTHSTDRMVRSQSFTHFRQQSPAKSIIPRSFSFNRAVELAKPLPNTQLCPVRTPGLKPPQCLSLGLDFEKSLTDRCSTALSPSRHSLPSNSLKKPLLPKCVLSQPSTSGYRQTQSCTAKPQHPNLIRRSQDVNYIITTPPTPESGNDALQFMKHAAPADLPDTVEEMSVSSASSERNDAGEDLLEDLYQFSDQSHKSVPDSRGLVTPSQKHLQADVDSLGGSSVELSPSSSSGGAYMWDEEMMEPLEHNTHSHTQNYITDSIQDADLILEANNLFLDLPENLKLQNGEKDNCETREHQKHGGTKHLHNNNRLLMVQGFDDSSEVQSDDPVVAPEEFSVKQMLQDCSAVKSQLLKLKFLLQMEDGEINSTDWHEMDNTTLQVQELLKEVSTLKDEVKNKDKVISELRNKQQQQHQLKIFTCTEARLKSILSVSLSVEQMQSLLRSEEKEVKVQKADKFTQTPRRYPHTGSLSLWCSSQTQNTALQHTHVLRPPAQRAPYSETTKFNHHRGPQ